MARGLELDGPVGHENQRRFLRLGSEGTYRIPIRVGAWSGEIRNGALGGGLLRPCIEAFPNPCQPNGTAARAQRFQESAPGNVAFYICHRCLYRSEALSILQEPHPKH